MDEDPKAVELLQEFLSAKGYEVSAAGDGVEALRKGKEERPHLILLDIQMPMMDGLEVLRQLRAIDPAVGVIIITGVNEEATGRQAMGRGRSTTSSNPWTPPIWNKACGTRSPR